MSELRTLRLRPDAPYRRLVGVGGIGGGMFLALQGDDTLGRNESRPARLLEVRDYAKLHIVAHHVAVLLGARSSGVPFGVVPVARVGEDDVGRRLVAEMGHAGMDASWVETVPGLPTLLSVCFQYPDGSGGNITTSDSAAARLTEADVDHIARLLDPRTIALAAPEVGLGARRRLLELATERGALRVASLTSAEIENARASGLLALVDLLALNEDEAAILAGFALDPAAPGPFLGAVASVLDAEGPGMAAVITAGSRGAFALEAGTWVERHPPRVEVRSTAGAGDALLGGVLAAIAAGVPLTVPGAPEDALSSALDLGVALAALSVTSPHTIHPEASLDTVLALAREGGLAVRTPLSDVV
ncbi:MAG: carbohydrate kinase family protein [Solirubrobacterales bacterium]